MGLLNKLKNVLFEEEEIEETKEEETVNIPKATMELPKITREPKKEKYDVEEETDRELFKVEKTFDFPAFDEEEFEDFAPKKKEEKIVKPYESEKRESRVNNSYSRKNEYTSTRIVKSIHETQKKAFKPSPVISPVYGILDKNYKKEDVVTRDEINEKKNLKIDVDSVRKKAFGTLEEDLAATLSEPIESFYQEEKIEPIEELDANLENLLEETIDEEIDVTKEMEIPSRISKTNYDEIDNEEIIDNKEKIEIEDVIDDAPEVKEDQEEIGDDSLENDLFELIDSMYENREDEN